MPTALERSREFLARGVARVRAGLGAYERGASAPGPEIDVEPFGPGSVTTAAGLVKLGTSIAAARRRRANLEMERERTQLERDRIRAEIARLRAQEKYYLGEGRRPELQAGQRVVPSGPHAGKTYQQAGLDIQQAGLGVRVTSAAERARREAARASITDLDRRVEQRAKVLGMRRLAVLEPYFALAAQGDEEALRAVGIDPEQFNPTSGPPLLPNEQLRLVNEARAGLLERATARALSDLRRRTEAQRRRAQEAAGFGEETEGDVVDYVLDEEGNFVPAGP